MHISNGLTVTLPITAFQTRNRFFRIKLSWLALITSAIGNSNLPPELNVVSNLGNPYIYLWAELRQKIKGSS
jgi:hypothetical protein